MEWLSKNEERERPNHRLDPKSRIPLQINQEEKRKEQLKQEQKDKRLQHLQELRTIALKNHLQGPTTQQAAQQAYQHSDNALLSLTPSHSHSSSLKTAHYFASLLLNYDPLIDPPLHLASQYYLCAKPEGARVLLTISKGFVTVRTKQGRFKEHFRVSGFPRDCSLLDCSYDEGEDTYWVHDVLMWNGSLLTESGFECRYFLLRSRFQERGEERRGEERRGEEREEREKKIRLVLYHPVTLQALLSLYYEEDCREEAWDAYWKIISSPFSLPEEKRNIQDSEERGGEERGGEVRGGEERGGEERRGEERRGEEDVVMGEESQGEFPVCYRRDALLFVHREAHYSNPWSPLFILFRDEHLSRYCIDTQDMEGAEVPEEQTCVLQAYKDGSLLTLDEVTVGTVEAEKLKGTGVNLSQSPLVQCVVRGFDPATRTLEGVEVIKPASKHRALPEPFSRIVSQFLQRRKESISFESLLNAL